MSQWYLSKNGQALGPLEENKVIALIEEGDLSPVDLVYQTGASEWLPVSEVEPFASCFHKKREEPPVPPSADDKEWVILKKVASEKGKEYKQLGPFSVEQVFQMIDRGETKFTDFAWKQGMETWVKINDLDAFASPLPSSPPVDTSIYEKTNVDFEVDSETVVDKEKKASLTEMVQIEHFRHEKTRVQPMVSAPADQGHSKIEAGENEPDSSLETDEEALYTEVSEVTPIPINQESFVTESDISAADPSDSDISLWSLEPPSAKKKSGSTEDPEKTEVGEGQDLKPQKSKKKRPKPKARPKKKNKEKVEGGVTAFPLAALSTESWQWVGVISAVIFAAIFFYQSFKVDQDPIQYDETSLLQQNENGQPANQPKPYQAGEIDSKMADYQRALEKARDVQPKPVSLESSKIPRDVVKRIAPAPPGPKVPIAEKKEPVQKRLAVPSPKNQRAVVQAKSPSSTKSKVAKRKVAGKKKAIKERAKIMQKTKKKVTPKPKKVTSPKSSRKVSVAGVAVASGGAKDQSFYKQRDRMALFYSSLKAETLAVEISNQFQKLKGSQPAWSRYYGQWRKKVQISLAKDIREFPKRKEKYAYPKVLAEFKKDYDLFYKYGESFDAKVKGNRTPSGVPTNMRAIFTRYKNQAKSLGL